MESRVGIDEQNPVAGACVPSATGRGAGGQPGCAGPGRALQHRGAGGAVRLAAGADLPLGHRQRRSRPDRRQQRRPRAGGKRRRRPPQLQARRNLQQALQRPACAGTQIRRQRPVAQRSLLVRLRTQGRGPAVRRHRRPRPRARRAGQRRRVAGGLRLARSCHRRAARQPAPRPAAAALG
ncbi:hypothetical protein D3C86_1508930 [compost metagenome]